MKNYVHARLTMEDRAMLEELKKSTDCTESELVRRGLKLTLKELSRRRSALDLAGRSVGRFNNGPRDLASNKEHLEDFGK